MHFLEPLLSLYLLWKKPCNFEELDEDIIISTFMQNIYSQGIGVRISEYLQQYNENEINDDLIKDLVALMN